MRISDWSSDVCSSDLGDGISAAQLDLVAMVVGQRAIAVSVDEGIVEVLGAAGIAEIGVRVDRALGVALAPRQRVRGVERPLVIPSTVDLQFQGLVGALGLGPAELSGRGGTDVLPLPVDELVVVGLSPVAFLRSEEHTSELQSLMR